MRIHRLIAAAVAAFAPGLGAQARAASPSQSCNPSMPDAIVHVELPGQPFQALPTKDGCWIFVSVPQLGDGQTGALAVIARNGGRVSLVRTVPVSANPVGMALTSDERLLVVTAGDDVIFVDPEKLRSGGSDVVIGRLSSGSGAGRIYAGITLDDRLLFIADERALGITVVDLPRARASAFAPTAIIGRIATGRAPIAVMPAPEGRYLYATSQEAPRSWNWPFTCKPQMGGSDVPNHPEGVIWVVDLERARRDPASSVVATVAAGCNPVRLVLSPKGETAYVTARGANALLAFDTERIRKDTAHSRIGTVPVGTAPVGVAVYDEGRRVVVTNSNRFAGGPTDSQLLTVIDASRVREGAAAVLGTIPAGAFPRELRVTADGKTLVLTNFASRTVQLVDLARVKLAPPR